MAENLNRSDVVQTVILTMVFIGLGLLFIYTIYHTGYLAGENVPLSTAACFQKMYGVVIQ